MSKAFDVVPFFSITKETNVAEVCFRRPWPTSLNYCITPKKSISKGYRTSFHGPTNVPHNRCPDFPDLSALQCAVQLQNAASIDFWRSTIVVVDLSRLDGPDMYVIKILKQLLTMRWLYPLLATLLHFTSTAVLVLNVSLSPWSGSLDEYLVLHLHCCEAFVTLDLCLLSNILIDGFCKIAIYYRLPLCSLTVVTGVVAIAPALSLSRLHLLAEIHPPVMCLSGGFSRIIFQKRPSNHLNGITGFEPAPFLLIRVAQLLFRAYSR